MLMPALLILLLSLGAVTATSCGRRGLGERLPQASYAGARGVAASGEMPLPPPEALEGKPDGPYWGPYRLPGGKMAYTADTIREYHLEGLVEPGVYAPGDADPLANLPPPAGGGAKTAAAGSPHDMNHDGMASPTMGNVKVLVLKVKWANTASQPVVPTADAQKKYFEDGTDADNVSLREYYRQQSWNQLNLSGDVYPQGDEDAAYELPGSPWIYGSLCLLTTNQARNLVTQADDDIDFTQYDADGNGFIDALHIVFQRLSGDRVSREHVGAISGEAFYWNEFIKDGIKIYRAAFIDYTSFRTYNTENYAWWDYTPHHEHGHILGLPDLYDYGGDYSGRNNPGPDGDESNGCGFWCLMASGNYTLPVQNLSAPFKYCLGWTDAAIVTENLKNYRLGSVLSSKDNVLRVWKDGLEGEEYFILENNATSGRKYLYYPPYIPAGSIYQNASWLAYDFNPGLLIWHVDERVWYEDRIDFGYDPPQNTGEWGFGCNDHEQRKFIDLEECTAAYMVPLGGSGGIIDDKDYMGGRIDPWPSTYSSTTYNRMAPDTTPDTDAYEPIGGTGSTETGIVISNIHRDGSDVILDVSIGAPYVHFPLPEPLVLSGVVTIEPDEVENTVELEYLLNGEPYAVRTEPPWGIEVDTAGIGYGVISLKVVAQGVLPELVSERDLTYIVDNTAGAYPYVNHFETAAEAMAYWTSNDEGVFERLSGGYSSATSFGVHSYAPPDYPDNLTAVAVTPLISLPTSPTPTMTVRMHYNLESGADIGSILISTDYFDQDWTLLKLRNSDNAEFSGYQADWVSKHVSVSNWAGQQVHIAFLLETDTDGCGQEAGEPAGWWFDQIVIANSWAESVPLITSSGLPSPAYVGVVLSKPTILISASASNDPVLLEYSLLTTGGELAGNLEGPPFETELNISALPNQIGLLTLRAFDARGIGSPIVQVPVHIFNLRGDVNGDGEINEGDRDALAGVIGLRSSDPSYLLWYDSDNNGVVNEADLAAVGYFWGGSL